MHVLKLTYTCKQKKRSSTLLSLALSELEASETLVEAELFREALVHMYFCCFHASQALLARDATLRVTTSEVRPQIPAFYSCECGRLPSVNVTSCGLNKLHTQSVLGTFVPSPRRESHNYSLGK